MLLFSFKSVEQQGGNTHTHTHTHTKDKRLITVKKHVLTIHILDLLLDILKTKKVKVSQ